MTTPRVYKTEAIILKRTNLGEADRILTLYTPYLGKFRAVAKGVRRPTSKLGGHVELLIRSQMMLARGQNLDIVTQSQAQDSFLPLREDLRRIGQAFYIAELMDAFTAERIENPPLYQLLLRTLHWLCEKQPGEVVIRYFDLYLLECVGYRPELRECLVCRRPLEAATNWFSVGGGGMLCLRCSEKSSPSLAVSPNCLKIMRFLQDSDMGEARRLRISAGTASELEGVMRSYIQYLLERRVKSVDFLEALQRERSA